MLCVGEGRCGPASVASRQCMLFEPSSWVNFPAKFLFRREIAASHITFLFLNVIEVEFLSGVIFFTWCRLSTFWWIRCLMSLQYGPCRALATTDARSHRSPVVFSRVPLCITACIEGVLRTMNTAAIARYHSNTSMLHELFGRTYRPTSYHTPHAVRQTERDSVASMNKAHFRSAFRTSRDQASLHPWPGACFMVSGAFVWF